MSGCVNAGLQAWGGGGMRGKREGGTQGGQTLCVFFTASLIICRQKAEWLCQCQVDARERGRGEGEEGG